MSLLRLLTTGRSLVGLKDAEPRYRMTRQKLLPRFGSGKNPFCAKDKPVAPRMDGCGETGRGLVSSRESKAVAVAGVAARDSAGSPATAASREGAAPASAKGWSVVGVLRLRTAALHRRWTGKLNGLLSRPGRKPVRAASPRPAKLAVQGELSLDRIKVVRNDLSDTDLEVVRAPAKDAAAPRAAEKAEPGATAWGRLAARVRGAGKT